MSGEDFGLISIADLTQEFVRTVKVDDTSQANGSSKGSAKNGKGAEGAKDAKPENNEKDEKKKGKKVSLLRRFSSLRSPVRPNFGSLQRGLKKVSCMKGEDEDELPMVEVPRHKSIDIGVGLARRMSLFIFTKKTACVHPYHPYVPKQTTRKIYVYHDD